ncbi:MAG TPA: mandelate racemase/muconate lactonizing enzyme family protein [Solirubrobacterales bacterium]|nr:mandelate racemase/muconate lactonizing enzyme family protein [Solirubrobacterales bacterium]
MRIASVEVIPYALPFREPYVTARGRLEQREMVLLRLRSEEGVVGLGEAVPMSLRGGATLEAVVDELRRLEPPETLDEKEIAARIEGLSAPGRCAVSTALLDLHGRLAAATDGMSELRQSFLPLSGGNDNRAVVQAEIPVPCNATLVSGEPAAVAADALRWAADGFSTFKLKLGAGDDVGQVRAVREAVGPQARIRVDANASWDLETAMRTLAELEPFGIELAEQPVTTLEELAELSGSTSIPLAADESVSSLEEAEQAASLGACAYTGIKLSKVGGPEQALEIADVLPAYVSSALDGPVGIAAAAQVAQTLHETDRPERLDLAHGLATQRLFSSTVASVECELRDGMLHPPPGPGLGVEIDERALDLHRL